MPGEAILDLTGTMEGLINEQQEPQAIMRKLFDLARALHQSEHVDRFAIGDGCYTLQELKRIQDQEEHDTFLARHRPGR
ncbi:hypothetical protein [uncultured Thiodictyon sp.]|jgi:hypothetical protein|uniref:hypothetical protein n=1 Tax=uncultured Thiodictyon sp. TaxID=1846217 RepID=UPI0025F8AB66|nr:hypothetical protein [uncultured Thiodictyon sp.]